jgi:hypothetical protein
MVLANGICSYANTIVDITGGHMPARPHALDQCTDGHGQTMYAKCGRRMLRQFQLFICGVTQSILLLWYEFSK